jgi:hypothetical protein
MLVAKIDQARAALADAESSCASGARAAARRSLEQLARRMVMVRSRTRTLRARKTAPPPLAARIGDEARDIAAAARELEGLLQCP